MNFGRALLLLSLCCLLCSTFAGGLTAQTSAAQEGDVIRIDTDVTNLLFTAADKRNRFITTLREEDIRVLEDGVPQQLFTFQRETDRLLSIAFLIDVSASEERTLPQEKAAVRSFVETIIRSRKDEAAIIPFTGYAFLEQALTGNMTSIYLALNRVDVASPAYLGSGPQISGIASGPGVSVPSEGSTAIWDAISVTASEVLARSPGQKRRAIILLTDGQDTSSRLRRSAAIDQAITAEAVIYAIGIGDSKRFDGVNDNALRTVAERTGGRAFFPKKETDLTAAFQQIELELRSQYLVAYSSTNKKRDGTYRQMRIEITSPELLKEQLRLRYRPGYFARRGS
jgi:Ca-activated chloride channel homolog